MLTNLIASVVLTLSTNVVETDNAVRDSYATGLILTSNPPQTEMRSYLITPATEKYQTETVTETKTLQFEAEGQKFQQQLGQREVSSVTRTFKLKQEWVDAGVKTNEVALSVGDHFTITRTGTMVITNDNFVLLNDSSGSGVIGDQEFVKRIAQAVRELNKGKEDHP